MGWTFTNEAGEVDGTRRARYSQFNELLAWT